MPASLGRSRRISHHVTATAATMIRLAWPIMKLTNTGRSVAAARPWATFNIRDPGATRCQATANAPPRSPLQMTAATA